MREGRDRAVADVQRLGALAARFPKRAQGTGRDGASWRELSESHAVDASVRGLPESERSAGRRAPSKDNLRFAGARRRSSRLPETDAVLRP